MKNFLPAMAGLLAIAFTQPAFAQTAAPCDSKGIFTDPNMPAVNPEYPARTNTFNWYSGQQNNGMAWNLNSVAINEPNIQMPWWQTDNAPITNLQGKLDLPKDGWELMKRDLGYDNAGQPTTGTRNPYVILYNKRTGMLRVFTAVGDLFSSFQFIEIKLRFNASGSSKKSATLNRMEGIGTALLDTPLGNTSEFSSIAPFLNYKSKWFMADFPMEYDPCACQFDSKLEIRVNLIAKADVKEQSTTTGTLITTDVNSPSATKTGSGFDQAFAMGKKIYDGVSAGQKTYKSIDTWASAVKTKLDISPNKAAKSAAIDALKAAMKNSSFLKAGLNSIPYVGLAVSAFDAFFGGGKEESGPQPVALQPMTIEMNTITTGTITSTSPYSNPTFNNPGTAITTALDYPYYNEAMGVFSLIKKPVVEYRNSSTYSADGTYIGRVTDYHVAENLQYVINPASGLEVQEFQVALMQGGSKLIDPAPSGWNYEGFVPQPGSTIKKYFLRTDYVDSGCLTNQVFNLETDTKAAYAPSSQPVYLKFIINLKPKVTTANTQNVLVVLKYPVTLRSVSEIVVDFSAPCLAVQPQMAVADVQAVCTGSTYQAAVTLPRSGPAKPKAGATSPAAIADVQVYPNPTAGAATIRFTGTAAGRVSAYVTDMFGHRVLSIMQNENVTEGAQQQEFATTALPPGLYQCVVETPDGKRVSTRLSVVR